MRPEIVTFWHGPLDALRTLCLRSQVAAGHKVTVYSFEPLAQLPEGVGNAEAEAILPRAFAERLRPTGAGRGVARLDHIAVQRFLPDAADGAADAGLWLDADVLLLKPIEIDPAKPYFAWERPRQLGNSVLYLPSGDPIVAAFAALMQQDELTPDWLALRHRLTFGWRKLRGSQSALGYSRRDLRSRGADRARPPRRRTALRLAEEIILCGACRTEAVLRAAGFFRADRRSRNHRASHFAERPRQRTARAGKPVCVGGGGGLVASD